MTYRHSFRHPRRRDCSADLSFQRENAYVSMGLNDLNRLDVKKGAVYTGLDCQTRRIRLARLETLPNQDEKLVVELRKTLNAVQRLGRPIHIFRGAPCRHPAIFYCDSLPRWLETLLGGDSLLIEQIRHALEKLELYESISKAAGLALSGPNDWPIPIRTSCSARCASPGRWPSIGAAAEAGTMRGH